MAGRRGFGTISKVKLQNGERRFVVRWRERGKRRKRFFITRDLAERFLGGRASALAQESALGIRPVEPMKFADFVEAFPSLFAGRKAPSTVLREVAFLRAHAVPYFGTMRLDQIQREDVERWILKRTEEDGIKAARANRCLSILSSCFRLAERLNHARMNPCAGIPRKPEATREPPFLSFADQEKVLAELPAGGLRELATLLLDTGLRLGEALRLTWRDFDPDRGVLVVLVSKNREPRTVPVPPRSRAVLEALSPVRDGSLPRVPGRIFEALGSPSAPGDMELVTAARKEWGRARKRAGFPGLRLHDLRHTYGTHLAMAGCPVGVIQAVMGHLTPSVTLRYSSHAPTNYAALALDRLEALRAKDAAPKGEARAQ